MARKSSPTNDIKFRCGAACFCVLQCVAHLCSVLQSGAVRCTRLNLHLTCFFTTLQHTATHCNILQHTATHCNTLQHTAIYCNTLQPTATQLSRPSVCRKYIHICACARRHIPMGAYIYIYSCVCTATHCSTLLHTTVTHGICNLIYIYIYSCLYTATHCNTLNTMQHTAIHYRDPWGLQSDIHLYILMSIHTYVYAVCAYVYTHTYTSISQPRDSLCGQFFQQGEDREQGRSGEEER